MNEPTEQATECCKEIKEYVRENPAQVILAAAGVGLLLALVLTPRKRHRPDHRALQILEDIEHRLKGLAEPVYRRAISAADRGAAAVKEGIDHLEDMDIPSSCCSLTRKLKNLFR